MKFKIIIFLIFLFQFNSAVFAADKNYIANENTNINNFLNAAKDYVSEDFMELDSESVLSKIAEGTLLKDKKIPQKIIDILIGEVKSSISIAIKIIAISILCSLIKNIQANNESGAGELAFYACYLCVFILAISSYSQMSKLCAETMNNLTDFMNILTPLIFSFLAINGSITSVTLLQPILILMTNITSGLISKIILPIIFSSMMFNVIGNISENINLSKLPDLLQKTSIWVVNFILILFISVMSIEGTLSANVDGLTSKMVKVTVSTAIPVIGKALSDATDSVIGATVITKNALGVLGIAIILFITIIPIIKAFVMMSVYTISATLVEPIVDKRMSKFIFDVANTMKILFALMCTVSILFIISITLMIKVGNFTVMYR